MIDWLLRHRYLILLVLALGVLALGTFYVVRWVGALVDPRNQDFGRWWIGSEEERQAMVTTRREPCPNAPFLLPAEGYIGLLYADPRPPYSPQHRHQGIDIFSIGQPGTTPVYAAYDGYLTRESSWRSAIIIRHPTDPLQPGRQIWTYYAHMADREGNSLIVDNFPPGTREVFVEQGTLLGYTGNYSNNPLQPVATHLHFSIVLDDGMGHYRNELEFGNTISPSAYLGMEVDYDCAPPEPGCTDDPTCPSQITP